MGNISFYVFLDFLGGKYLGVTLWASQVCPLQNFFFLRRRKEPLRSLAREVCSPPRGPLPLHAQSLLWRAQPLTYALPQFSCISKKPNTVHNPSSKTLEALWVSKFRDFQILERLYCSFTGSGTTPHHQTYYFCNKRYDTLSGIHYEDITPIQIRFYCQMSSDDVGF